MRIEIRLDIESISIKKDVHEIIDFEDIRNILFQKYKNDILNIEYFGMNKNTNLIKLKNNRFIKYHGDISDYQRGRRPSNILFVIGNGLNTDLLNFEPYIRELYNICNMIYNINGIDNCKFNLKIYIEKDDKFDIYVQKMINILNNEYNIQQVLYASSNNEKVIIENKISKSLDDIKYMIEKI